MRSANCSSPRRLRIPGREHGDLLAAPAGDDVDPRAVPAGAVRRTATSTSSPTSCPNRSLIGLEAVDVDHEQAGRLASADDPRWCSTASTSSNARRFGAPVSCRVGRSPARARAPRPPSRGSAGDQQQPEHERRDRRRRRALGLSGATKSSAREQRERAITASTTSTRIAARPRPREGATCGARAWISPRQTVFTAIAASAYAPSTTATAPAAVRPGDQADEPRDDALERADAPLRPRGGATPCRVRDLGARPERDGTPTSGPPTSPRGTIDGRRRRVPAARAELDRDAARWRLPPRTSATSSARRAGELDPAGDRDPQRVSSDGDEREGDRDDRAPRRIGHAGRRSPTGPQCDGAAP